MSSMFGSVKPQDVINLCNESLRTSKKVYLPEVAAKLDIPRDLVKMVCEKELDLVPSTADDRIYMTREDRRTEAVIGNARLDLPSAYQQVIEMRNSQRALNEDLRRRAAQAELERRQQLGQAQAIQASEVLSAQGMQSLYEQLQQRVPRQNGNVRIQRNAPLQSLDEEPKKKMKVTFDSVILDDDRKKQIKSAISQIEHSKVIFDDWGFSEVFEKGTAISLLFYGVPGTGKTLMAQAIAEELNMELKIYGTAEIQSSEPGGAERAIKRIFAEATELITNKKKQRVVLFDECDSLLYSREKVGAIMAAQINALLSEIERYAGIIIFTTNRLQKLDSALERRLSAKIEFPFPSEEAREKIWKGLIPEKAPLDKKSVDFKKLAKFPIAGGNIKNVVLNAARYAAHEKAKTINIDHFKMALQKELEGMDAFQKAQGEDGWEAQDGVGMAEGHGNKLEITQKESFATKPITGGNEDK